VVIPLSAAAFGLACAIAGLSPSLWFFAVVLVIIGLTSMTMMNTANAYVQTTTDPIMRGRVMALYLAIFAGGTPIGAPIVGWVANVYGARWALAIGAASGLIAAAIAGVWMLRRGRLAAAEQPVPTPADDRELATQEIAIVESTTERTS
jgi:MFS family permease